MTTEGAEVRVTRADLNAVARFTIDDEGCHLTATEERCLAQHFAAHRLTPSPDNRHIDSGAGEAETEMLRICRAALLHIRDWQGEQHSASNMIYRTPEGFKGSPFDYLRKLANDALKASANVAWGKPVGAGWSTPPAVEAVHNERLSPNELEALGNGVSEWAYEHLAKGYAVSLTVREVKRLIAQLVCDYANQRRPGCDWPNCNCRLVDEPGSESVSTIEQCVARYRKDSADEDGFWRTCSGCYECEDGYPNGYYPHSEALGCTLGGGCSDCGGIGAVWDTTDYEAMANDMIAEERAIAALQANQHEGDA